MDGTSDWTQVCLPCNRPDFETQLTLWRTWLRCLGVDAKYMMFVNTPPSDSNAAAVATAI